MVRLHMNSGATMRYSNFRKDESSGEAFFIEAKMLTYDRANELFIYDKSRGLLIRKTDKGGIKKGTIAGSNPNSKYSVLRVDGHNYLAHRLIWLIVYGEFPDCEIDHINRDKRDNRIENLRAVSRLSNEMNKGVRSDNTSGLRGIFWNKKYNKWCASVQKNGSRIYAGQFHCFNDAVISYVSIFSSLFNHDEVAMQVILPHKMYLQESNAHSS